MNKQLTIIIIAVIVLVVGWVFLGGMGLPAPSEKATENNVPGTSSVQNEDVAQNGAPNLVVVSYNKIGFSPESTEVSRGETVIFINLSDEPLWVASAIHPTHQLYPGFDSLRAFGVGERYEFTFDQKGEWKYHNHMRPGVTGTIIVK